MHCILQANILCPNTSSTAESSLPVTLLVPISQTQQKAIASDLLEPAV